MSSLPEVTPLVQRYPDPYYSLGKYGEHYLMSDGVRSRHESSAEVYRIIDQLKRKKQQSTT